MLRRHIVMDTERASPRYSDIDLWDPPDILEAMLEGQMSAVAAVRATLGAIAHAASATEERLRDGGRLVYVGAGTSGRLAVQDGAELVPTFNWPPERLLLLIAGGKEALLRATEGAEDETAQAIRLMQQHGIASPDVVIAVAASGTTPFTLTCLREAKRHGALTVGIANNRQTPLLHEADCAIPLDTGSEPIAGSTRMKAGTAQRVTLNLLSSLVMIRLGHVHGGLMVDVQAINAKLVRRSEMILHRLTGRGSEEIAEALRRANGSVKLAVLLLHGCSRDEGVRVLERAGGRLRLALQSIGAPGNAAGLAADARVTEELPSASRSRLGDDVSR
jgi:N-acetylmuramic acid 6-phosphate etherase